ncbi:stalk domain-containing protein [Paenibacillus hexagrammi]|uniref:stalk domain-containing protein n=1 Tax=Paenibacillus hexagrammi TaxID=2908839 RepID=UPI002882FB18|nr:stalk domain-containing protein [Paenibacillus sp. YPD9-1]
MKKKLAAVAIGLGMFVSLGTGVYAGSNLQEIKAYLNGDIQIKYNGEPVQLQDEQGQVVLPITYEGSTYMPLRGVANILKTAVDYDPDTNTVYLGEKQDGVPIAKRI